MHPGMGSNLIGNQGWPWTTNALAATPTSGALGLQVHTSLCTPLCSSADQTQGLTYARHKFYQLSYTLSSYFLLWIVHIPWPSANFFVFISSCFHIFFCRWGFVETCSDFLCKNCKYVWFWWYLGKCLRCVIFKLNSLAFHYLNLFIFYITNVQSLFKIYSKVFRLMLATVILV